MKHSDVEELARKVGLIEPRDVWADLPADYRQALCSFSALVLEKSAGRADSKGHHWSGAPAGAFFDLADELRSMSAALQSGDRG